MQTAFSLYSLIVSGLILRTKSVLRIKPIHWREFSMCLGNNIFRKTHIKSIYACILNYFQNHITKI